MQRQREHSDIELKGKICDLRKVLEHMQPEDKMHIKRMAVEMVTQQITRHRGTNSFYEPTDIQIHEMMRLAIYDAMRVFKAVEVYL